MNVNSKTSDMRTDLIRGKGKPSSLIVLLFYIEIQTSWTVPRQGLPWNGRQIRGACQTALAIFEFKVLHYEPLDDIGPVPMVMLKLKHFTA